MNLLFKRNFIDHFISFVVLYRYRSYRYIRIIYKFIKQMNNLIFVSIHCCFPILYLYENLLSNLEIYLII